MRIQNSLPSINIASTKFIKHHLTGTLNKIKYHSRVRGYCYCKQGTIAKKIGRSRSQFNRNCRELEDDGHIFRERIGRKTIYWTPENFKHREHFLALYPPEMIGRKKLVDIAEFSDPKMTSILSTKFMASETVVFGQNKREDATHHATHHATHPSHSLYNDMNTMNTQKKEVVIKQPKKPRPSTSAKLPSFQRDLSKEQISPDMKAKLHSLYCKEEAEKRILNATKHIKDLCDDGEFKHPNYQMGVDGLALMWCEIEKKRVDKKREKKKAEEAKELLLKEKNDPDIKPILSHEEIIAKRKLAATHNGLIFKYGALYDDHLVVDEGKISEDLRKTLVSSRLEFNQPDFDEKLARLIWQLGKESLRKNQSHEYVRGETTYV